MSLEPTLRRERSCGPSLPVIIVGEQNDFIRRRCEVLDLDPRFIGGEHGVDFQPRFGKQLTQFAEKFDIRAGRAIRHRFEVDNDAGKPALLHIAEEISRQLRPGSRRFKESGDAFAIPTPVCCIEIVDERQDLEITRCLLQPQADVALFPAVVPTDFAVHACEMQPLRDENVNVVRMLTERGKAVFVPMIEKGIALHRARNRRRRRTPVIEIKRNLA